MILDAVREHHRGFDDERVVSLPLSETHTDAEIEAAADAAAHAARRL